MSSDRYKEIGKKMKKGMTQSNDYKFFLFTFFVSFVFFIFWEEEYKHQKLM